jgi:thiamine biosynthesis lipoprotein
VILRTLILYSLVGFGGGDVAPAVQRFEARQTLMGSEFKIVVYTIDEPLARRAQDAAFARVAHLNDVYSDYDPESELMRFCAHAGGPAVKISDDLYRGLDLSIAMARRSDGAFDPTISPVGRLWRRARRDGKLPDAEKIAEARKRGDWTQLILDPQARTAQFLKPDMKLDLGGIAKGIAADEAMKVLEAHGIEAALVAAAGDIVVRGAPPETDGWRIGVAPVERPEEAPSRFLILKNAAVSTSGDAERFVVIDGERYSHIVDPKTGLGVRDRASVTVVAPRGATADPLATAVYVLGPEQGGKLVAGLEGCSSLFVRPLPDGREQTFEAGDWRALRVEESKKSKEDARKDPTPGCKGAADDYNDASVREGSRPSHQGEPAPCDSF